MPDWKIHTISALLVFAFLLLLFPFNPDFALMALLVFLLSSLLPDLDHPNSLIRQVLGLFCSLFISLTFFVSMEAGLGMRLASSIIMFLVVFILFRRIPLRHRGKRSLHKWKIGFALFVLSLLLFWFLKINIYLSIFILAGYWLHLALDRFKYKR